MDKVFCWASPTAALRPGCQSVVPSLGTGVDKPCRHWRSPHSFFLCHTGPACPGPRRGSWGGPMAWWDLQQGGCKGRGKGELHSAEVHNLKHLKSMWEQGHSVCSREMEAPTCWRYCETAPGKCETYQPRREMNTVGRARNLCYKSVKQGVA